MTKQNTSFPHGFAAFCIFCCYPLPLVGIGTACQYHVRMRLIGNILWLILGGLLLAASWAIIGLVLCITIVGIPLGIQAFKMAGLTLTPFGKTVEYGGGVGSVLINIIWFVLAGLWMAIGYILAGLLNSSVFRSVSSRSRWPSWPCGRSVRKSAACKSLQITSDHFTQHRRPSTAVLHISIEELRSEQAATTAS